MAELSKTDRDWIEEGDALKDLMKHPAWPIYEEKVLNVVISDLHDMLLNGPSGDLRPEEEVAFLKAIRIMIKTLVAMRERPLEILKIGRKVREILDIPEPEEN